MDRTTTDTSFNSSGSEYKSWNMTFPDNPDDEPGKFCLKLSIVALATYLHERRCMDNSAFRPHNIDGNLYWMFNTYNNAGNTFAYTLKGLVRPFQQKLINQVVLAIKNRMEETIDVVTLDCSWLGSQCSTDCESASSTSIDVRTSTHNFLSSIVSYAKNLKPIAKDEYPLRPSLFFNVRTEENLTSMYKLGIPEDKLPKIDDIPRTNVAFSPISSYSLSQTKLTWSVSTTSPVIFGEETASFVHA